MADYTPRYRNINLPSACGRSAISGAIPSASRRAIQSQPVDIVHMLAEVGAWGVNLHDNDLVPIDATAAEREQIIADFKRALDETSIVCPMATTNLFADPSFKDGTVSSGSDSAT